MPPEQNGPQLTKATLKVLSAFCQDPKVEMSGREVGQKVRLPSGTVYPILLRLKEAGWLSDRWEDVSPQEVGRPRRRFYLITGVGYRKTQEAVREINGWYGAPSWTS